MYVAEMDATIEDLRVMAMHHRSPINSFMFSNKGVLLDANTSALEACHAHTPGINCHQNYVYEALLIQGIRTFASHVQLPSLQSTNSVCGPHPVCSMCLNILHV